MATTRYTWHYRVVRRVHGGETFYNIHEAYYEEGSLEPHAITKEPVAARGETVGELADVLEMMRQALKRPALDYDDF